MGADAQVQVTRGPDPSDEEMAAIMAAVQTVLASGVAVDGGTAEPPPRWRFSGRWWSKPVPQRRDRPALF